MAKNTETTTYINLGVPKDLLSWIDQRSKDLDLSKTKFIVHILMVHREKLEELNMHLEKMNHVSEKSYRDGEGY